jgi:hypothetical protein
MSNTPQATGGLLLWVKNNALVTITILGVLLYVVLSIPITFFYARLGTTPGEVGFTYTSILSGSTLAALAIVGIITAILAFSFLYLVSLIAVNFLPLLAQQVIVMIRNHSELHSKDDELDDERFDRKLKALQKIYGDDSRWPEVERALRRKRELARLEIRTAPQESEATNLDSRYTYSDIYKRLYPRLPKLSRRWRAALIGTFLLLTIAGTTVVLTVLADGNADTIRKGQSFSSSNLNIFGYHAEPVEVVAASKDYAAQINLLISHVGRIFLLGQNAQNVILYVSSPTSSGDGQTVRIPVSEVVLIRESGVREPSR